MWTVFIRNILPLKPVLDEMDGATDDVSSTWKHCNKEERFDTLQLAFKKTKLSRPLQHDGRIHPLFCALLDNSFFLHAISRVRI